VRIIADTNVLVRAVLGDDPPQARLAANPLISADIVAVPLPVLCEFVWVLLRRYGRSADEIAASIRDLADSVNVHLDRPAVDAGLAILEAGVLGGRPLCRPPPGDARRLEERHRRTGEMPERQRQVGWRRDDLVRLRLPRARGAAGVGRPRRRMAPVHRAVHRTFGVNRCMFESNFPPDKQSGGYTELWNAFKRITANASAAEKTALYSGTAARVYRMTAR
jgi:predicted nucleic acid-binding protein